MVDRPSGRTAAVLVGLDFGDPGFDESLDELKLLAASAGIRTVAMVGGRRKRPDAALFAGSGKVEEIKQQLQESKATLAVFNHPLSPAQERNLEKALGCRVVDRTSLIIDIFAQRAQSHEGKVQVELAQLEHAATRLVRGWTHLERQRGGRGFLGGMGETQLEVDRRLIASRVKTLKDELVKLKRRREVQRRARSRGRVLSISIVGYTNAGKSTLFNCLTRAGAIAEDRLFATLDTTTRRVYLAGAGQVVISDTVGFIRDLPHSLVAAFRATLEETIQADLLLHVVDASSAARDAQIDQVNKVLAEIGANAIPQVLAWNKIDKTEGVEPGIDRDEYGRIRRVRLSAKSGLGVDALRQALIETAASRHSPAGSPISADSQELDPTAST